MKIAIIGSGISGLTCAYKLHQKHNVTIFETNNYLGGHTHTHDISLDGKNFNVDSGFLERAIGVSHLTFAKPLYRA